MKDKIKFVKLTKGKYAIVDAKNFKRINKFKWHCQGKYARSQVGNKRIYMHKLVLGKEIKGMVCDHIDRDPTNNMESNLRICTQAENSRNNKKAKNNTSGFIGVSFCKFTKKWEAYIKYNYKRMRIGRFEKKREAAEAYDFAAIILFGEYANLNLGAP